MWLFTIKTCAQKNIVEETFASFATSIDNLARDFDIFNKGRSSSEPSTYRMTSIQEVSDDFFVKEASIESLKILGIRLLHPAPPVAPAKKPLDWFSKLCLMALLQAKQTMSFEALKVAMDSLSKSIPGIPDEVLLYGIHQLTLDKFVVYDLDNRMISITGFGKSAIIADLEKNGPSNDTISYISDTSVHSNMCDRILELLVGLDLNRCPKTPLEISELVHLLSPGFSELNQNQVGLVVEQCLQNLIVQGNVISDNAFGQCKFIITDEGVQSLHGRHKKELIDASSGSGSINSD